MSAFTIFLFLCACCSLTHVEAFQPNLPHFLLFFTVGKTDAIAKPFSSLEAASMSRHVCRLLFIHTTYCCYSRSNADPNAL
jgi:hypothetical protein